LKDLNHSRAIQAWQQLGSQGYHVVLTDWIIAETGNGLARSSIRDRFAASADQFTSSPTVEVVFIRDYLSAAVEFYRCHQDKTWGLVDCASFLVMQDRGITEAFTSDRHFEQAGFTCLL